MNGVGYGVKAGIVAMLACVALLASGCGKDEPKRSALAENLAQLCEQARADTEELGLPSEKGFVVMAPTAARGLRLAADIKKLKGTTAAEKEQIASLAEYFRFYYNELNAAVKLYAAGQSGDLRDHALAGEALARKRRGARYAHGRARVRRAAVPRPLAARLRPVELGLALLDERLDALVEVVRLLEQAVGEPFELEPDVQRAVVDGVEHALRHRHRQR